MSCKMNNSCFDSHLFTVIIPTYNRANMIRESLDSVFNQTYRPIELIVIDDGSNDDTLSLLNTWAKEHAYYKDFTFHYYTQENAGACAARNYGIRMAQGEYIQFLDSDDLLHPERLERIVRVFNETSCHYVYTGFDGFCGKCGQVVETRIPESGDNPLSLFCQGRLWVNTLMFAWKSAFLRQVGYWNINLPIYQDYEIIIRTLIRSQFGRALPESLAHARRGGAPRLSDRRSSRIGYDSFLKGTAILCNGMASADVSPRAIKILTSRLYERAMIIYPHHPDIGMNLLLLARSLKCRPTGTAFFLEIVFVTCGIYSCNLLWRILNCLFSMLCNDHHVIEHECINSR